MAMGRIHLKCSTNIMQALEQMKKRLNRMIAEYELVGFITEPPPVPAIIDATKELPDA